MSSSLDESKNSPTTKSENSATNSIDYVRKTKPVLTKLEDRSTPMVFLSYTEGTKAYRLYDPHGDKVFVSRDVMFDEKAAWD